VRLDVEMVIEKVKSTSTGIDQVPAELIKAEV
jgi:hypothetical protein